MATKNKDTAEVETTAVQKEPQSVYTAKDLIDNHKIFNASKAIVKVALMMAKVETATFDEAKSIVEKFKNKEVK